MPNNESVRRIAQDAEKSLRRLDEERTQSGPVVFFTALAGEPYQTSDGCWLIPAINEDAGNWSTFALAIGRRDLLTDARFSDCRLRRANKALLVLQLDRAFGARPLAYWREAFDTAGLPYGVLQIPDETADASRGGRTNLMSRSPVATSLSAQEQVASGA
jgi:crotonobetainyl-CoA:carnitine CoA-transferase CaiB-like acyl-CoA transferase